MPTANLRKVGGSTMVAVPIAFLEQLHIQAGSNVSVEIEGNRIVIEPETKKRYTLEQLLEGYTQLEPSEEDQEWLNSPPIGKELI